MPEVMEMLELATECFGFDVEQMMRVGPMKMMARPDYNQMLMYVANCVAFEVLKKEYPEVAEWPQSVAGFSIGEYSALVAAGVMSYDQGLIIVKARADAMQKMSMAEDMEAVGIFGPQQDHLEKLCHEAQTKDKAAGAKDPQIHISHFWGKAGYVCAGRKSTVQQLREIVEKEDGVFLHVLEQINDASHTPMVQKAAEEVEEAIKLIPLCPPRCDVYFNSGFRVSAGEQPSRLYNYLVLQLCSPVQWERTISNCIQRGVQRFFECGPGESLRDLMMFNVYQNVHGELSPYDFTTNVKV